MNLDIATRVRQAVSWKRLTPAAKAEKRLDQRGLPAAAPDANTAIDATITWLAAAQDNSASRDGGVARDYSLLKGWATSYPETTGYIVPTMIDYGRSHGHADSLDRSRRMLDWLVSIQMEDGGFQGGRIDSRPIVATTFNTGQILLGLAAGAKAFGDPYLGPMRRAADWLAETQDADGCWRKFPTPFAKPGEKAYETHVAWGLFEADRVCPGAGYGDAGLRNVRWALTHQHDNGWFARNCLSDPDQPLTHTIGYVLRGLVEAYRLRQDDDLLDACRRTADGVLTALGPDGYLAGRLKEDWRPAVRWVCLTGSVQIAHCWLLLYEITGNERYREAGFKANTYVRRTIKLDGPPAVRGGIKGSFPVDGDYGSYEYLNWAAKFFIDSHMLENRIRGAQA